MIFPEDPEIREFASYVNAIDNNSQIRDKIMLIDPEKRKELKINKSTLWYQQKRIKEGKTIKMYRKTRVKIE